MAAAIPFSGLFLTFEVFDLCDRLKSYNISLEHLLIFTLTSDCLKMFSVIRDLI